MPKDRSATQSAEVGKLVEALAKAQGTFKNPEMTATAKIEGANANYEFKYAPMVANVDAVRRPLSDNGILVTQRTDLETEIVPGEDNIHIFRRFFWLETKLWLGEQWMAMWWPIGDFDALMRDKQGNLRYDPKKFGAARSYAARYSLSTMLVIASEEDVDGDAIQTQRGAAPAGKPRSVKMLQGKAAVELEERLIADLANNNTLNDMSAWARDTREQKQQLPPENYRNVDAAFARREEEIRQQQGDEDSPFTR